MKDNKEQLIDEREYDEWEYECVKARLKEEVCQ